jgi:hypothetical protein
MHIILFLLSLIACILQILILNYLIKLEQDGCACAMDYKRTYILAFMIINFIITFISLFSDIFINPTTAVNLFLIILGIGSIINIVFIIQYVAMLKNKQCNCSESVYRDIMYYWSIIDAILLGMILLQIIFFMFLLFFIKVGKLTGQFKSSLKTKGKLGLKSKKLRVRFSKKN